MAKAKFVPRQRKHKVLARERAQESARHAAPDSNAADLPAKGDEAAARADKARLRAELRAAAGGAKMSGQKAKRLDKYIDAKLRKDENRALLAKLAARRVDTSLFASSRALGQGRETRRQLLSRVLRERRAGVQGDGADDVLFEERRGVDTDGARHGDEHDGENGDNGGDDHDGENGDNGRDGSEHDGEPGPDNGGASGDAAAAPSQPPAPVAVGSGLKRPLQIDEEGRPIIKKRQKRGGVKSKVLAPPPEPPASDPDDDGEYEDWGGFSDDEPVRGSGSEAGADGGPVDGSDSGSSSSDGGTDSDADSSDDASDESADGGDDDGGDTKAQRSSAFKAWALQQRNESLGFRPADVPASALQMARPDNFVPRAPEQDPLPAELKPTTRTERKAYSVAVKRTPEMQTARLKLPVVGEEQRLMEAIHDNDVVVICGSTGSGKTTQVPQFLYEAGYGSSGSPTPGMIGITQPRRVAAVSMSRRVADELGDHAAAVAYQIRFEGTVDAKTAIKFMTDGVLLREIAHDFALRKYSAIVIDEAHERSVNTDILIGMLSRVIKLRAELSREDAAVRPLKLIIMSATLRIEDLTMNPTLFATPPRVLEVDGRQHPVTLHFARRTHHDYVEEAFRKICRGHRKLPPGGFLVFLTGRDEILRLSKRLKEAFGGGGGAAEGPRVHISAGEAAVEVEDIELGGGDDYDDDDDDDDDMDDEPASDDDDDDDDDGFEGEADAFRVDEDQQEAPAPLKMQVLPLYSLLPTREQMRVFEPAPDGTRRVVLATNVAETSLTMPGTRFVFDCGRAKERHHDRLSGVQSYRIGWISKASADQRAGRAGRTGPGHCYRLYSSAVYERDFCAFADPELLRMPIEGVVLQLKAMKLQHVVNFPFPTPPDRQSLVGAERLLTYLSALSATGQVTAAGRTMSLFPLSPRFARILLVGHAHGCLPYTVALVAGLSAGEVFVPESAAVPALAARDDGGEVRGQADVAADEARARARRAYKEAHRGFCFLDDRSDAMKLLQVVGEHAHEPSEAWCERHFVRHKALREAQQLRRQLTELLRANVPAYAALRHEERLAPPTATQVGALKQMVAAGFLDRVAMRADLAPSPPEQARKPRRAVDVPYVPLARAAGGGGGGDDDNGLVYIHPASVLAQLSAQECPEYVVYAHLQRAAASGAQAKTRMHALTDVTGGQLAALAKGTPLLGYGKPIKEVKPAAAGGGDGGATRECWVVPYLRAEGAGGLGWPLPARKVRQRRVAGRGWVVE